MTFTKATRTSIKPLIGLFGESGGGKTLSALLLGRGIVGPEGKLGMIDTENGRGSIFSDIVPNGYDVLEIGAPFTPQSYIDAIDAAEQAGIQCLVVDSTSHEWNGEGGYLDMKEAALDRMAGNDWRKREACKFAASAQCKPEHNKFVQRLLRAKMAVILCFRAKDKVKMEKDGNGKTKIITDDHVSPISETGLIFEMLIAGEVYAKDAVGGYFRCTKFTHMDLRRILPEGEQVGVTTGKAISDWCNGGASMAKAQPTAKPVSAKSRCWEIVAKNVAGLTKDGYKSALVSMSLIDESTDLSAVTEAQWAAIYAQLAEFYK